MESATWPVLVVPGREHRLHRQLLLAFRGDTAGLSPLFIWCIWSLETEIVLICIQSGEVRSDHKWSPETHVETHHNARCELMRSEPSTCDQIAKDACILMQGVNRKDIFTPTVVSLSSALSDHV